MRRIDYHPAQLVMPRINVGIAEWDARTGALIGHQVQHNLAVTAGRNLIRDLLAGDAVAGLTHFALGTSGTAVQASDTALGVEVHRDIFTTTTKDSAKLTIEYFLSSVSANGYTLREAGLFNDGTAGSMYARVVLSNPIEKNASKSLTFTWELTWGV